MKGTRQYEDWMNRHAIGAMGILSGFAGAGLIVGGLGVFTSFMAAAESKQ